MKPLEQVRPSCTAVQDRTDLVPQIRFEILSTRDLKQYSANHFCENKSEVTERISGTSVPCKGLLRLDCPPGAPQCRRPQPGEIFPGRNVATLPHSGPQPNQTKPNQGEGAGAVTMDASDFWDLRPAPDQCLFLSFVNSEWQVLVSN